MLHLEHPLLTYTRPLVYKCIMNRLSLERRTKIIACLVEGNSVNGTCRITDTAKHTVLKLLADVATACQQYQFGPLTNCRSMRVELFQVLSLEAFLPSLAPIPF